MRIQGDAASAGLVPGDSKKTPMKRIQTNMGWRLCWKLMTLDIIRLSRMMEND